jgi:hypothetical protein
MEHCERQQEDYVSGWAVGLTLLTGLLTLITLGVFYDYLRDELEEFLK